jgi:hypothetical protein
MPFRFMVFGSYEGAVGKDRGSYNNNRCVLRPPFFTNFVVKAKMVSYPLWRLCVMLE